MPNAHLKNTAFALLLSAVLAASAAGLSSASGLKDIRLGEYNTHARIVFEFDRPVGQPLMDASKPAQLDISFPGCIPTLGRKVPLNGFNRIREIKIRERSDHLTASVFFPFDRYLYKWFELKDPARTVIDIFDQADTSTPPAPSRTQSPAPGASGASEPDSRLSLTLHSASILPVEYAPEPAAETDRSVSMGAASSNEPAPQPVSEPEACSPSGAISRNLQFYLVMTLISLAIAISAALLLMFVFRQYWTGARMDRRHALELLRSQDQHIGVLNQRIQEQLRRYDKIK